MKVAVIGSRELHVDLEDIIPQSADEIISGGARGIDSCASNYAKLHNIKLTEYLPDYASYNKKAPLLRNKIIIQQCDMVIAIWDGVSTGTLFTIKYAYQMKKPLRILILKDNFAKGKAMLNFLKFYESSNLEHHYIVLDDIDLEFVR